MHARVHKGSEDRACLLSGAEVEGLVVQFRRLRADSSTSSLNSAVDKVKKHSNIRFQASR